MANNKVLVVDVKKSVDNHGNITKDTIDLGRTTLRDKSTLSPIQQRLANEALAYESPSEQSFADAIKAWWLGLRKPRNRPV